MTEATATPAQAQASAEPRTYLNFIGGEWRSSVSGQTFDNHNPARYGEIVGRFQTSAAADIDAAIAAAEKAFPAWSALPAPARGEIILRAALLLEHRPHDLPPPLTPTNAHPSRYPPAHAP